MSERQTFLIQLDSSLAREVLERLKDSGRGYAGLEEFVVVALINQLSLEKRGEWRYPDTGLEPATIVRDNRASFEPTERLPPVSELLRPIPEESRVKTRPPRPSESPLFVLTNRFGPIKVAARVLANMIANSGQMPEISAFQSQAARAARELGMRIRESDEASGRAGRDRRWIGFPVGKDGRAAEDRFISSFTIAEEEGAAGGPMAILQIADVEDGRVGITEEGLELAAARSPLLDYFGLECLSEEESSILRGLILKSEEEVQRVRRFLRIVRRAAGKQTRVDELLSTAYPEWSWNMVTSHRAAMLGRLEDAKVLAIHGRGSKASISLLPHSEQFNGSEMPEEEDDEAVA